MKMVSLTVTKVDGIPKDPYTKSFVNTRVIHTEPVENGTLIEYENQNHLTKKYQKTYEVLEDYPTVDRKLSDNKLSETEKLTELVSFQQNEGSNIYAAALAGDMVLNMNPDNIKQIATSDGWKHEVILELLTKTDKLGSKGNLHDWYSGKAEALIRNTSIAGVASIDTQYPQFIRGRATVIVKGSKTIWKAGEKAKLIIVDSTILGYTIIGNKTLINIT